MHDAVSVYGLTRTAILADALSETVAELGLIELSDMVAYIQAAQWANIADLIESSAELSFIEGTLCFACSAAIQIDSGKPASISLDMEFQVSDFSVFFRLTLGACEHTVEIEHIWFAIPPSNERLATFIFARAIEGARLRATISRKVRLPPR